MEVAEKKTKALEIMKELNIYKPYIKEFEKQGKVCLFEGYGGYWVEQYPEIYSKMKEIEEKYSCTVYAITHEYTAFGDVYDFLLVSDYPEEWDMLIYGAGNTHTAFAFVWNRSNEMFSEFGDIGIYSFGGGIKRVS